ncbi:MAG: hypothetical protein QM709_01505 [Spongiibacteraceae bacterium]
MKPSVRLLKLLALWLTLALGLATLRLLHAEILPIACIVWWSIGGVLLITAVIDMSRRNWVNRIEVQRNLPDSFAVGVGNHAEFIVRNRNAHAVQLDIVEDHPTTIDIDGLPATLVLPGEGNATLHYRCTPRCRGDAELGRPWLRLRSRWQLWEFFCAPMCATPCMYSPISYR